MASHWLSCDDSDWLDLFLGKEKIFRSLAGVVETLLIGKARYGSSCWVCNDASSCWGILV